MIFQRAELLASISNYQVSEKELSAYQSASKLGRGTLKGKQFSVEVVSDVTRTVAEQRKWGKKRNRSTGQCQIVSNRIKQEYDITGIASQLKESESSRADSSDENEVADVAHVALGNLEEGSDFQVQDGHCVCKLLWILYI